VTKFLIVFVSGIDVGAVTALVALGVLVLYKATGMLNFAQGNLLTLGAYIAIWGATIEHLPLGVAYALAIVGLFVVGVVLERVAVAPLRNKSSMLVVMVTFGASYVIATLYELWFAPNPVFLPAPFQGSSAIKLGPLIITDQEILIVVVCAIVIALAIWIFQRTGVGRQVRALAADREVARLYGVKVTRLSLISWGVSAALAGVAAVLIGPLGAVDPSLGSPFMLSAFAACALGGFGSIYGAIAGSMVIGITQQVGGAYFLSAYGQMWPFVILILAIAIRPQGILSRGAGARL
jgi:branched-chain amino acid transport system permease protein